MLDITIFVTAVILTGILMSWRLSGVTSVGLLERRIQQRQSSFRGVRRSADALLPRLPRRAADPVTINEMAHLSEPTRKGTAGDRTPAVRRPRVFYDGGCPLCRREIEHYRRLDQLHRLEWIDITRQSDELQRSGLSFEQAMARFHVMDSSGRWRTGAHGFAELWSHLPYFRWLAKAVRGLRLLAPLEYLYRRFAGWRARRRYNGGLCSNHETEN